MVFWCPGGLLVGGGFNGGLVGVSGLGVDEVGVLCLFEGVSAVGLLFWVGGCFALGVSFTSCCANCSASAAAVFSPLALIYSLGLLSWVVGSLLGLSERLGFSSKWILVWGLGVESWSLLVIVFWRTLTL